jgi:hypothetical protein
VLLAEQRDAAAAASALLQHHRHWRAAQPRLYSTLLPLLHRLLADAAVLLGDAACGGDGSSGTAAAPLHIATNAAGSDRPSRLDRTHSHIAHEVSSISSATTPSYVLLSCSTLSKQTRCAEAASALTLAGSAAACSSSTALIVTRRPRLAAMGHALAYYQ